MLRRVYKKVSKKLDAQIVARNMFQRNALTLKELESIQSKHSEPVKAAEQLLNIVMNQSGNVYCSFLDALKNTSHQQLFDLIVSGSYKGMHSRGRKGTGNDVILSIAVVVLVFHLNVTMRYLILIVNN